MAAAGWRRLSPRTIRFGTTFALLALAGVRATERALTDPLERFDEGILLNSVSFLASGLVPVADAYQPYGPGYGLPGLPGQILFGTEALVTRLPYLVAPSIVVALAFFWLYPRAGFWSAAGIALLVSLAEIPRYSLPWICVFCFLIAMDRTIRRSSGLTLDSALTERAAAVAAAGAVLAMAAWFRLEYGVFVVVWIATVVVVTRRRPPFPVALVPLIVALLPIVVVLAAGGPRHFGWWLDYALSGFREFRSQPFNASAPLDFARVFLGGEGRSEYAYQTFSYFAGGLIVAAAALNALLAPRRPIIDRDATGLSTFLIVIGAIVLYAQSVRFFGRQGYAAMPLLWTAFAALPFRSPRIRPVVLAGALLALAPMVAGRFDVPSQIDHASTVYRESGSFRSVEGLRRIPLNDEEKIALPALRALWKRQQPGPSHTFVINRRNDDAQANEAFVYWFLDVKPAAWPTTFDPGLADRDDVQREAVADLCTNRSPLVQAEGSYLGARPQSRSDVLDQFVAFGYDVVGAAPLHRILLPRSQRCRHPQHATTAELRLRRDALVAQGELPEAGVMAQVLVARAQSAGRPIAPGDLALATLAGRKLDTVVADDVAVRVLLAALAAGDGSFAYERLAADRGVDPLVRLAAILGHVRSGGQRARPEADRTVADAAIELATHKPQYVSLSEAITAMVPPGPAVFERLRRAGVRADWFTRWQFDYAISRHDVAAAVALARSLLGSAPVRPVQQASVLASVADVLALTEDVGCSEALRRVGDALRGVGGPAAGTAVNCRTDDLRHLIQQGRRAQP